MLPYATCININQFNPLNDQQSSFVNYFQSCSQPYSIQSNQPYNLFPTLPLPYPQPCLNQQQQQQQIGNIPYSQQISQRVGGSVMVYRLVFRPPFTWTYNCFCDCEENTAYVPRVPGQHTNFTEADAYVKRQLREVVREFN
ncbi:hypothetical protein WUBG_13484 [Wuchereria bancrofti]|uniref:Uncharacterized protein n=1 Tax=Wuchereria bancrofti TaxID=6293 RepID=J9EF23_WUCBA|nr:hypothetical protein WUBG_13484 [Wuchereria bancrofti]